MGVTPYKTAIYYHQPVHPQLLSFSFSFFFFPLLFLPAISPVYTTFSALLARDPPFILTSTVMGVRATSAPSPPITPLPLDTRCLSVPTLTAPRVPVLSTPPVLFLFRIGVVGGDDTGPVGDEGVSKADEASLRLLRR